MPLGKSIGLGSGDIVLDGDPAPPPQKKGGQSPLQFSAHVCCGQTAVRISIPLCTEVGLGLGDIVINGILLPLP